MVGISKSRNFHIIIKRLLANIFNVGMYNIDIWFSQEIKAYNVEIYVHKDNVKALDKFRQISDQIHTGNIHYRVTFPLKSIFD